MLMDMRGEYNERIFMRSGEETDAFGRNFVTKNVINECSCEYLN